METERLFAKMDKDRRQYEAQRKIALNDGVIDYAKQIAKRLNEIRFDRIQTCYDDESVLVSAEFGAIEVDYLVKPNGKIDVEVSVSDIELDDALHGIGEVLDLANIIDLMRINNG